MMGGKQPYSLFCRVLLSRFVQNSCIVLVKFFSPCVLLESNECNNYNNNNNNNRIKISRQSVSCSRSSDELIFNISNVYWIQPNKYIIFESRGN